jgi:hypothetical protein
MIVIVEYPEAITDIIEKLLSGRRALNRNPVVNFDDVRATNCVESTSEFSFGTIVSPKMFDASILEREWDGFLCYSNRVNITT